MKQPTHIILSFPSQSSDVLYRASDGMAMACRQGLVVISGDDPNPAKRDHRNFMDETYAVMYLRKLADLDLHDGGASIEMRPGEAKIIKPNELEISNARRN